jgi:hypothetical protein
MVSRPRGGLAAFFEMNFRAWVKLQKVFGYSGYTSSALIQSTDYSTKRKRDDRVFFSLCPV